MKTKMACFRQDYAVELWMQHFLDIDPNSAPDYDVSIIISSLYTVMDPKGRALKSLERIMGEGASVFGIPPHTPSENSSLPDLRYGGNVESNAPQRVSTQRW